MRARYYSCDAVLRSILYALIAAAVVYDIHLHVIYRLRDAGVFDMMGIAYIYERTTQDAIRHAMLGAATTKNNNEHNADKEDNESASGGGGGGSKSGGNNGNSIATSNDSMTPSGTISFQFPTVEERVRYYMGSWYHRKSGNKSSSSGDNRGGVILDEEALCNDVPYYDASLGLRWWDLPYIFEKKSILENAIPRSGHFFDDARDHVFRYGDETMDGMAQDFKAIMLFGDFVSSQRIPLNYPIMFKARIADAAKHMPPGTDNPPKVTPILAMLETQRHYRDPLSALDNLADEELVTPWERKMNTLLWRGATSGQPQASRIGFVARYVNHNDDDTGGNNNNSTNTTDKMVDVGFTDHANRVSTRRRLRPLMKTKLSFAEQLRYKYLLSLEGNDVATGLKWMLYSNSVVFMPYPPTRVSWAMEDKLVPFYHFVPLKPDVSDLLDMVTWARANDEKCKQISRHATEYVKALYASDEAKETNDIINRKIVQRYHAMYGPALAKCDRDNKRRNNWYAMACDNVTAGNGPYQGPFADLEPCRHYTKNV